MKPITTITSPAVPLLRDNIDTDTIIPSREMRSTGRTGLADGLFAPWRYSDADARLPEPGFVLNHRDAIGTRLLLAGSWWTLAALAVPALMLAGVWWFRPKPAE